MLPSMRMLYMWLKKISIRPGWNQASLIVMQNHAKGLKEPERVCRIIFDAVHLQEHLNYIMGTDNMEGVKHLGEFGRSNSSANYASGSKLLGTFFTEVQ